MTATERDALIAALRWHVDEGIADLYATDPVDATAQRTARQPVPEMPQPTAAPMTAPAINVPGLQGASERVTRARAAAEAADTLDALRAAIAGFDGLSIRNTATNLVFADGLAGADIMVIGDVPGADDDRAGLPFQGSNGLLFDRMFASIGFARAAADRADALYLTNLLNWRPPGSRTPTDAECEISLPFLKRHIELAAPKLVVLMSAPPVRALLRLNGGISSLRGKWHELVFETGFRAPVIATYHPSYLMTNPMAKRAAWADLLAIQDRLHILRPTQ